MVMIQTTDTNQLTREKKVPKKKIRKIFSQLLFFRLVCPRSEFARQIQLYMLLRVIEFSVDDSMSISAAHNCNCEKKGRKREKIPDVIH